MMGSSRACTASIGTRKRINLSTSTPAHISVWHAVESCEAVHILQMIASSTELTTCGALSRVALFSWQAIKVNPCVCPRCCQRHLVNPALHLCTLKPHPAISQPAHCLDLYHNNTNLLPTIRKLPGICSKFYGQCCGLPVRMSR